MKTAAEILVAERTARVEREARDQQWAKLIAPCRAAAWQAAFWSQLFGLILFTAVLHRSRPDNDLNLYLIAGIALIWSVATHFSQRRGRRAMLALIARESPELHQKLKREGIA